MSKPELLIPYSTNERGESCIFSCQPGEIGLPSSWGRICFLGLSLKRSQEGEAILERYGTLLAPSAPNMPMCPAPGPVGQEASAESPPFRTEVSSSQSLRQSVPLALGVTVGLLSPALTPSQV